MAIDKVTGMMNAIKYKQNFSQANVVVMHHGHEIIVTLHGHKIAVVNLDKEELYVSWCGYPTPSTTKLIKPIVQHFLNYSEGDVKVQVLKGDPTITIGTAKHVFHDDTIICIEYDKNVFIEIHEPDYLTTSGMITGR